MLISGRTVDDHLSSDSVIIASSALSSSQKFALSPYTPKSLELNAFCSNASALVLADAPGVNPSNHMLHSSISNATRVVLDLDSPAIQSNQTVLPTLSMISSPQSKVVVDANSQTLSTSLKDSLLVNLTGVVLDFDSSSSQRDELVDTLISVYKIFLTKRSHQSYF